MPERCGLPVAAHGASSRRSWAPTTTPCRPTTSRKTRGRSSRTARRRRTSACTCFRPSLPGTWGGSAHVRWPSDSRRPSRRSPASSGCTVTCTTGTTRATCESLEPAYLSTVDSGNLCGHLLAVSNACREMLDQPLPVEAALAGIDDAIALTREAAAALSDDRRSESVTRRDLDAALEPFAMSLAAAPETPGAWAELLTALATQTRTLVDVARAFMADRAGGEQSELVTWAEAAQRAVSSHARDLDTSGPTMDIGSIRSPAAFPDPGVGPAAAPADSAALARAGIPDAARVVRSGTRGSHGDVPATATLVRSLQAIADEAQRLFRETDFGLPLRADTEALLHRVPGPGRVPRSELLRPPGVRGSPRQLPRDRQGRRGGRPTGSGSAARSRRSVVALRSSPGRDPCSST